MLEYHKLYNVFNVSPSVDFRFKGGDNGGLGHNVYLRKEPRLLSGTPRKLQFKLVSVC